MQRLQNWKVLSIHNLEFRLSELVQTGDGVAIVEAGLCLGGGFLQQFGINSNTSANGFIKCLYRKKVSKYDNQSLDISIDE